MIKNLISRLFYLLVGIVFISAANAEGDDGPDEKDLKKSPGVFELGSVEGEHINHQDNTYYWEVKDVHLPTNGGLDIEIYRSHGKTRNVTLLPFESFELEVPRIELSTSMFGMTNGEHTGVGMCEDAKSFDHAHLHNFKYGSRHDFTAFNLIIPGEPSRQLLFKGSNASYFPSNAKYITTDNWYVRCVDSSDPNGAKNTFEAVSPQGTVYTFDEITREPHTYNWYMRGFLRTYASKVTDRNGNTLTYTYERVQKLPSQFNTKPTPNLFKPWVKSYLKKITSSDGQSVTLNYTNLSYKQRISNIKANGRTWTYSYSSESEEPYTHGNNTKVRSHLIKVTAPGNQITSYEYRPAKVGNVYDFFGSPGYANNHHVPEMEFRGIIKLLKKITTPKGLSINYEYEPCYDSSQPIGRFPYQVPTPCWPWEQKKFKVNGSVSSLAKRTLSGQNMSPIIWEISRSVDQIQQQSWNTLKNHTQQVTTYKMPDRTIVSTYHMVNQSIPLTDWKHGTLISRRIYTPDADLKTAIPLLAEYYNYSKGTVLGHDGVYYEKAITEFSKPRAQSSWHRKLLASKIVDINGKRLTTTFQNYDVFGFATKIIEQGTKSKTTNIEYEHNKSNWLIGLLKKIEVDGGSHTINTFDSKGNITEKNDNGIVSLFSYNTNGTLKEEKWYKDSINDIKTITYENYKRNKPQLEKRPEDITLHTSINDAGNPAWKKDGKGNLFSFEYDSLYRITKVIYPEQSSEVVSWDEWKSKTVTRGNEVFREQFNPLGQPYLTEIWDINSPNDITYIIRSFDSENKVVFESRPTKNIDSENGLVYTYDALGRTSSITDTANNGEIKYYYGTSANTYLSNHPKKVNYGHLVIDARGFYKISNYDVYGNPDETQLVEVSSQVKAGEKEYTSTTINWNLFNNISSITQGGITKKYEYFSDRPTLLKKSIQPEVTTSFTYDLASNMTSKKVGSLASIKYSFDDLNRLTKIDFPNATPDINTIYDKNNNIVKQSRSDIIWDYQYNSSNQLTEEKLSIDNRIFNTLYDYDHNGILEKMTYPSGREISLTPDSYGNPTQLGSYVTDIKYHENGKAKSFTYGNGLTYAATFDTRQLPSSLSVRDDSFNLKKSLTYLYDKNFNITKIGSLKNLNYSRIFSYDGLERLINVSSNDFGVGTIQYDQLGNIKKKHIGSRSLTYNYNSNNQLSSISGSRSASFTYDQFGNIVDNGKSQFDYGYSNEVTKVTGQGASEYYYDGNKKRVKVIREGKIEYHVYSINGQLLHKYISTENKKFDYLYLQNQLLAKIEGNPVAIPSTPGGLSNSDPATGTYQVRWYGSADATRYELYESVNNKDWTRVYSGSNKFKDIYNKTRATYYYKLKACNFKGCSGYSSTISVIVPYRFPPPCPRGNICIDDPLPPPGDEM